MLTCCADGVDACSRLHGQGGCGKPLGAGALVVRDVHSGVKFQIGSGFTEQERIELWSAPPIDRVVRYKFFEVGVKDAPRHPVFTGFRDPLDVGGCHDPDRRHPPVRA